MARLNPSSPSKPPANPPSPRKSKPAASTAFFDIYAEESDDTGEPETDQSSARSSWTSQASDPLRLAQVNALLLPPSQRPRSRTNLKLDTLDFEKENDPIEEEVEDERIQEENRDTISRSSSNASALNRRSPARRGGNPQELAQRRNGNVLEDNHRFGGYRGHESSSSEEEESEDDGFNSLDDFIVSDGDEPSYHASSSDDSSNDEEEQVQRPATPPRPRRRLLRGKRPNPEAEIKKALLDSSSQSNDLCLQPSVPSSLATPSPDKQKMIRNAGPSISEKMKSIDLKGEPDDKEESRDEDDNDSDPAAQLQQDLHAITASSPASSPETPPSSPSKTQLRSPTKGKVHIPPTPYRESTDDAFWSEAATTSWVDQHSPRKLNDLLREFEFDEPDDNSSSSSKNSNNKNKNKNKNNSNNTMSELNKSPLSPSKPPSKTAIKKQEAANRKAALETKRAFDARKHALAEHFLRTLDHAVTGGEVQRRAQDGNDAGTGVHIVWSKTLQTTAGRASWKRDVRTDTMTLPDGTKRVWTTTTNRHAMIELAERIIDDDHRLVNTLAHEYCHLANYLISNELGNPHGASFREWGRKCEAALKDDPVYGGLEVRVTACHNYKIDYKYQWNCEACGQNYGRHSKSLDPQRVACGKCKGKLQQVKPKPRNVSPKKQQQPPRGMEEMTSELAVVQLD